MGKGGTDVAREDNIRKFISYVLSCKTAEILTVSRALLGLPLPPGLSGRRAARPLGRDSLPHLIGSVR
jgi:hypothetical protein